MKALTLKQPWAHAVMHLGKTVENRTSSTDYRGPLAIVAGLGVDDSGIVSKLGLAGEELDAGCIVGVVDLVDVHEHGTESCGEGCLAWGEFRPFGLRTIKHWMLEDPRPVPAGMRFPYTGFLGIKELGEGIAYQLELATSAGARS